MRISIATACFFACAALGLGQNPTVTLAGVGAGGVGLTTPMSIFAFSYRLEPTAPVAGLTVSVDDFQGPNGSVVTPQVTLDGQSPGAAVTVKQSDRPELRIAGTFPSAGDYKSNIVIRMGANRLPSIPVVVTRQWNAIAAQVQMVETARAVRVWGADATVRFTVKETAGRPLTIYEPKITQLALKQGDKKLTQARYTGAGLRDPKPSLSLNPRETREYAIDIKGIGDAGEYTGTLSVDNPDSSAVEQQFTVFVKDCGFTAFVFIFLGLLGSYLIRRFTKETRPRLDLERRIANLENDLDTVDKTAAPLPLDSARIFTDMKQSLAKAERSVEQGAGGDQGAALDRVNTKISKLPAWLTLGKKLGAVDPIETVQDQVTAWNGLADAYFSADPGVEDFDKQLQAIETAMNDALKAAAQKGVTEFTAVVTDFKTAHPNADTAETEVLIASAKTKADRGDAKGANTDLRQAHSRYAKFAANDLNTALTKAAPDGFSDAQWKAFGDALRPEIKVILAEPDAEKAIAAFDSINRRYVTGIVRGAIDYLPDLRTKVDGNGQLSPDDKKALKAQLDEAETGLKAAGTAAGGDGNKALASYQKAAEGVKQVKDRIAKTGTGQMGVHEMASSIADWMAPLPQPLTIGAGAQVPGRAERTRTRSEQLTSMIERYDLLLNLGLLLVATVLGLKLLWADNPSWGGAGDYAAAFLWGLGLQQVGGSTFEGLPAISKKVLGDDAAH